jgi:IPT/TIG domain-containing protein
MKTVPVFLSTIILLAIVALGCGGYGSGSGSGSGSMAAGAPSIAALVPNTATAGSPGFTLTVNGSGFVTGSVIYWSSTAHMTQVVTNGQLTTSISAAEVATAGAVPIHVSNPGGTGIYMNQSAQSSNTMNFMVQ